jgi:sterol desaturase/sphingolipid hydroxylase (fatty acid hydroxylase superfamily)
MTSVETEELAQVDVAPTATAPGAGEGQRQRSAGRTVANVAVSAAILALAIASAPRLVVGFAIAALITASLEVLVPLHDRRRKPGAYATDITEALGNRVLVVPVATAAVAVMELVLDWLTPAAVPRTVDGLAWPARLVLVLVLTDLAGYLSHRALHRVPVLWRLHQVHHSSEHVDWLATSRGHALDLAFVLSVLAVPSLVLGAPTEGGVVIAFLYMYPFVVHANARIPLQWLERVFVSPRFHHWHHAEDAAGHDRNFGTLLTVWDRLFGTTARGGGFPDSYGIGNPELANGDFLTHLAAPFRQPRQPN